MLVYSILYLGLLIDIGGNFPWWETLTSSSSVTLSFHKYPSSCSFLAGSCWAGSVVIAPASGVRLFGCGLGQG